jgi:hypothetical protein
MHKDTRQIENACHPPEYAKQVQALDPQHKESLAVSGSEEPIMGWRAAAALSARPARS